MASEKRAARRRISFEKELLKQGIEFERIDESAAPELWGYWRELFAYPAKQATGEWTPGGYHWHTFSYEYTYSLSREAASAAYGAAWHGLDPLKRGMKLLLFPRDDESLVYRCVARQPPELGGGECNVCPLDFAWTMAFTHEDGWLGPYFTRQEWVRSPPVKEPSPRPAKRRKR